MNVNTDKLKKEAGHACNFSNSIIVSVAITFQVKMFASPYSQGPSLSANKMCRDVDPAGRADCSKGELAS